MPSIPSSVCTRTRISFALGTMKCETQWGRPVSGARRMWTCRALIFMSSIRRGGNLTRTRLSQVSVVARRRHSIALPGAAGGFWPPPPGRAASGPVHQSTIRPMFRRRIFGSIEPQGSRFRRFVRYAFLLSALFAVSFTAYLDFRVRSEFEGRRFALPARIYAQPIELHAGLRLSLADVADELRENGYREGAREGEAGWFQRD